MLLYCQTILIIWIDRREGKKKLVCNKSTISNDIWYKPAVIKIKKNYHKKSDIRMTARILNKDPNTLKAKASLIWQYKTCGKNIMFCIVILDQCSFQPFMCVDSAGLKHGRNSSHLPGPAFKFSSVTNRLRNNHHCGYHLFTHSHGHPLPSRGQTLISVKLLWVFFLSK